MWLKYIPEESIEMGSTCYKTGFDVKLALLTFVSRENNLPVEFFCHISEPGRRFLKY